MMVRLMMGVDMMVMVIVMIHHSDTLYHDQADTAPLLGTDPAPTTSYILFECKVWSES